VAGWSMPAEIVCRLAAIHCRVMAGEIVQAMNYCVRNVTSWCRSVVDGSSGSANGGASDFCVQMEPAATGSHGIG
jgi:hypothetical protein